MFGLKSLPQFRSIFSKSSSVRKYGSSYVKIGNKFINLDKESVCLGISNLATSIYCVSFAGLFVANTGIGIYNEVAINKPFGDNCLGRNALMGHGEGAFFGLLKGITYSFGNVFFWANALYEHKYSNIIQTKYGKMRERDIRFHFIPMGNDIKRNVINEYASKEAKNNVKLLENLGVLNYDRRRSYDGY